MRDFQYQVALAQYRQHQYNGFRPWASLVPPPTTQPLAPKHIPHMPYGIPYLSHEPPILQNPERVVRISECERYEQSYQPNVALAPRKLTTTSSAATTNYTNGHSKMLNGSSNGINCSKDKERLIDIHDKLDKEQDIDDERNEQRGAIINNQSTSHIISMDIQIKKERPTTPSEDSVSPESHMQSSPLPTCKYSHTPRGTRYETSPVKI